MNPVPPVLPCGGLLRRLGRVLPVCALLASLSLVAATPAATGGIERQEIRAQLVPARFTTLAAEISGKILRLKVAEGDPFRAGDLLVELDVAVAQAQLQRARAELAAAEAALATNERLARLNSVGQLELELSRANVLKARAEVSAGEAVVAKGTVTAPYDGRVAEQKIRELQFVQAGQPLLEIIDHGPLELDFIVPSRWLAWMRPGGELQVAIDETDRTYPARFLRLGARVDAVSQSVRVAAAIDGLFPELVAGMSGRVLAAPPSPKAVAPASP